MGVMLGATGLGTICGVTTRGAVTLAAGADVTEGGLATDGGPATGETGLAVGGAGFGGG